MFRVRWMGKVSYEDGMAVQRALHANRDGDDYLLLLEHPHTYTMGLRARMEDVLTDVSTDAKLVRTNRGGEITYHGPGQLVGYPIVNIAMGPNAIPSHVHCIEQIVIDVLDDLGLAGCGRIEGLPGVWVDPDGPAARKICAIGVRITRDRSMHGFALNVTTELERFSSIVPCGITDKGVTSLAAEGINVSMQEVVDRVVARSLREWAPDGRVDRQDVAWRVRQEDLAAFTRGEGPGETVKRQVTVQGQAQPKPRADLGAPVRLMGRLAEAGVQTSQSVAIRERKPEWMRAKAKYGPEYHKLKNLLRGLQLTTVCEEAGCPNISECWADGTATFMILGERCTRACGFCLVDTSKPLPPDPDEPDRVAEAVASLGLSHAVVTMVARDDLPDGGAKVVAETVVAIRARNPDCRVETLISDLRGDPAALDVVFTARPDVLNYNVETVPRLQRAVRPSASYARTLAVLSLAKAAKLVTKTSIIVGMGETMDEVVSTMADLAAIGVDIVTVGQYLRPTSHHLPVDRWWTPDEFTQLKELGESMGIAHVESGPLTRSSYHARQSAQAAGTRAGSHSAVKEKGVHPTAFGGASAAQ